MATKFHTIVALSDKTQLEYDTFAESKSLANKAIIKLFSYRKVKSIHTDNSCQVN